MTRSLFRHYLSIVLAIIMVMGLVPITVKANVTGILDDAAIGITETGNGTWTVGSNSITGSVSPSGTCGSSAQNAQINLTNNSGVEKELSFTYSATIATNGQARVDGETVSDAASHSFSKTLLNGESVAIAISSGSDDGATTTIKLTNILLVKHGQVELTFLAPVNGTYTVNGQQITSDTTIEHEASESVSLVATPNSGYKFVRWYSTTLSRVVSTSASCTVVLDADQTIEAQFVDSSTPVFDVGGYLFTNLNDAAAYANESGESTIVLVDDGILPAGEYSIPTGKTLLIPYDKHYTVVRDTPDVLYNTYATPTAFKTLTMAQGARITVENGGAISCASQLSSKGQLGGTNGCPTGPDGRIKMNSGSKIILNNGSNLYCWGYIYGDGEVEAESGATVHEAFQIKDWRGGTATSNIYSYAFIFNQYYVQNIEVKLIVHAGATEKMYSAVNASSNAHPLGVTFIGNGGMFRITEGYLIKDYIESTDRLQVDLYGNASISPMTISGVPVIGSINTEEYILPITNNITINVHSGTSSVNQSIKLLPSVEVNIDEGANLILASGKKLYVYDNDDWGNFTGSARLYVVGYSVANGTRAIRNANTLVDAKVNINGTATVNGEVYTSNGGAQIISSNGTGVIIYNNKQPNTQSKIYEMANNSTKTEVAFNAAWLLNSDGSYYYTAGQESGTQVPYLYGFWGGVQPHQVTFHKNDGSGISYTYPESISSASVDVINSLIGWTREGYNLIGWCKDADGSSTIYRSGDTIVFTEDTNLYAQWEPNNYTITWKNADGNVLETDENVPYNSTPSYDGATPVKDSDDTNHYTFTGWDPGIVPVTGPATYTAVFTAEPHTYGTPSWTWTGYTAATATFTCSECGHTHPVTATITSVTTDPTCTSDGETVYTATVTFNGQNYTDIKTEVLSATGHTWGTPTYVWADDNSTVTATRVCANDPTHVDTETANTSYVVTTPATCENDGVGTYTATFNNSAFATQTKEVDIPATGHNWDLDNPVWGVPTGIIFPTVTITFTCTVCGETTQITAETVGFVTEQDASCVEGGYKEATFEASFGGRTFEKTIRWDEEPADPTLHPFDLEEHGAVAATCTEEGNSAYWYCPVCEKYFSDAEGLNEIEENSWIIPATGHSWGDPTWNWADDHSSATATFTCSVCGYSQTVTAEITSDTTPATPTQPGSIVYTATVEFNGNTYTNVETETLTYTGWKIDDNGKTYIIDGEIAYHNQWQTIEDATYWFDDAGYVLDCGIYWLPYPEGYGPDQWNIDNSNQPYTNAGYLTNSFFSIDANGKLEKDANGFRTLPEGTVVHCKEDDETLTESFEIWLVNGEMPWHPGLVTDGTDYYYFPTGYFDAKRAKISGTNYYISKTNELEWPDIWGEGVFSTGLYTFDNEGKLQLLDGLIDKEDKTYYYDHGMLTYAGVIKIGDYFYYVKSDYTIVKDATYYVIAEKTNGLTGAGLHDFDNYGHMFLPNGDPHFTGIIKVDDDNWFYYEDGVKSYAGLIEIDGHLYYVNSQFKVIHNADYPICKTNGLKPQGTYYFDENGWLEEINETLNGIVKEGDKWYYYVDGIKTYAGVFKIGNDFYYAKSDGEVIHGRSYYISKTNGLVEKGQYDFDEEGRMFMYNGIYKNDNGIWIYYVNGVKTYAGVILIDGYYYYVKSDFQVVHDRSYVVNKTNNLVSPGTYQFDAEGHMIIN